MVPVPAFATIASLSPPAAMKTRTLVAHHRYYGVDAVQLRTAAVRVLSRVVGLPPGRARVREDHLRQDFAVNTIDGMKDAAPKLAAKEAQIIDAAKSGKGVEAIKAAMK